MRTIRLLLLAVSAVIGLTASAFTFESGGIKYTVNDNSPAGACVAGVASGSNATSLAIPSTVSYNGTTYRVIQINYQAFKGNTTLQQVRVYWGVYNIMNEAFANCTNLTTVSLPSTALGGMYNYIFSGCTKLKTVRMGCIDASMVANPNVNANNFPDNANMTLEIPNGCKTSISTWKSYTGWSKFAEVTQSEYACDFLFQFNSGQYYDVCINEYDIKPFSQINDSPRPATVVGISSSNTEFYLGSGDMIFNSVKFQIEAIAPYACANKTSLMSVSLGNMTTLKTIGASAFRYCTGLTSATVKCEEIGNYAFHGCTNLKTFTPMEGIKKYGQSMLSGTAVTKINLPASLTNFNYAADGAKSCVSIVADANNDNYSSWYGTLYNKSKTTLVRQPEGRELVSFTDNLTSITQYAFENCTVLKPEIELPYGVRTIGSYAFNGCTNLKKLVIPGSVTSNLAANHILNGCTGLTNLYVNLATAPSVTLSDLFGSSHYNNVVPNCYLHTPYGKSGDYQNAGWTGFKGFNPNNRYAYDFHLPLTNFGEAYYTVTDATPASYTDSSNLLTDLTGGWVSFMSGDATEPNGAVTIPSHVEWHGKRYGVNALAPYSLPQTASDAVTYSISGGWNVKDIQENAARGTNRLTSVVLPNIEKVGDYAFSAGSSSKLETFKFPASLKTIGDNAFMYCPISDVLLPYGVTKVGASAFWNNNGCKRMLFPGSVTSFGDDFASACYNVEELVVNVPAKRLGEAKFRMFGGNTKIRVPVGQVEQYKKIVGSSNADKVEAGGYDFIYGTDYTGTPYHMSIIAAFTTPSTFTNSNGDVYTYDGGLAQYVYHPNIHNEDVEEFTMDVIEIDKKTGRKYIMVALGDSVFAGAEQLTSLDINGSELEGHTEQILYIGHHAFYDCGIDHGLTFDTPLSIGEFAFAEMDDCPSVTILGDWDLSGCFDDSYLFDHMRGDFEFYVNNTYFKKAYDYCMDWDMGDGEFAAQLRPFILAKAAVQPASCYLEYTNYAAARLNAYSVTGYDMNKKTLKLTKHDENTLNYMENGVILTDLEVGKYYKLQPWAGGEGFICSGDWDNYLTENWEPWTLKSDDPLKRWGWDEANQKFVHPASSMTIPGGSALLYIGDSDQALAIDEWTLEMASGNPLDVNNDGNVDVGDVNTILAYILEH